MTLAAGGGDPAIQPMIAGSLARASSGAGAGLWASAAPSTTIAAMVAANVRMRINPLPRLASGLSPLKKDHLPGGASRLAALLIAYLCPISSLFAPCHPGAALRNLVLLQRGQATRRVPGVPRRRRAAAARGRDRPNAHAPRSTTG